MNEKKKPTSTLFLTLAILVLVVVGLAIGLKDGQTKSLQNLIIGTDKNIEVTQDVWASGTTGVYYLPGDPAKCFIIQANPHGAQRGFEIEPSNAMSATMISGFAWVAALNPTRGKAMVWSSTARKEVQWTFLGTTMMIDGVTYWRRPKQAPWQCATTFTFRTPYHARSFPAANCQWLRYNPNTGGFLNYYTSALAVTFAAGGGHWDSTQKTGQVGGYHQSGALDGIYRMARTQSPDPRGFLLYVGSTRFAGGAYDFLELSTCTDPAYPTVTQQIGQLPTYPTGGATKKDADYRVTAQASWSQAAVACLADGLTLCTKAQYCPNGAGSNPELGKLLGDVWAPIGDMFQNFVQLADPNRICADHLGKYSVLPKWEYYGTQNTVFRCCVKPAALSSLSQPIQELILNDAEYRFILDGSWQKAEQACVSDGMHLCTELAYCPNGGYALPLLGTIPGGDVWAPITDSRYPSGNNWVQLSDLGRVCKTHADLYKVLPAWTSCCTGGKKTAFRCCH